MNKAKIIGTLEEKFAFSHKCHENKYYKSIVCCERLSGYIDKIEIVIPETSNYFDCAGKKVYIEGSLKQYDSIVDGKNKTIIYVYAHNIIEVEDEIEDYNSIEVDGCICNIKSIRFTSTKWVICDFVLASNTFNHANYLYCIAWGYNAVRISDMNIGDKIKITGRIQSREFTNANGVNGIAHEISVNEIDFDVAN